MESLMEPTRLVESQWEVTLGNRIKEASISLEETKGTIRTQEDTENLMVEMELHSKHQDPIMEVSMGDQTSIQTVRLH